MDDPSTDSLRKLAPSWNLAGDEQLLSILQNTHQRLLSKCQEANCQLEQMVSALNDASISLQNVNNQFMALSSSQFIESRVYDDDDVTTDIPAIKEPPIADIPDELSSLKRSLLVLENAHEIITILHDSDTESDTDDEMPARMVLKPKDMYADRPLPYIIGSQPWKNKWHAGLLLEDSDTDSTTSKPDHDSEQYSQSEPEDTHTDKLHVPGTHDTTVSETSSELPSEQGSVPKPTPSDVASEIARRLGARELAKMVEREPEYDEPARPAVRKIYRPQDPVSTTVFPDEPPPLSDSSEPDVFAELRRAPARGYLPGFDDESDDDGDIFSDFANKPVTDPSAKPTSLFDAGPAPHMFDKHIHDRPAEDRRVQDNHTDDRNKNKYDKPHVTAEDARVRSDDRREERITADPEVDRGVKKPVGGISLFGNKGTESIGAAILKRNQRKSSSSGDESETDSRSESQSNQQIRKEKDIFDDLFARSEGKKTTKDKMHVVQDIKTEIQRKNEERVKDIKVEKAKVDLFSDNLFDDIDDIFTTNVVKMPSKDTTQSKSIFEDDDNLFSEIAAPKPMKIEVASSSNKKSLFDSDDELFAENLPKSKPDKKPNISEKPSKVNKTVKITETLTQISEPPNINNRSIFDDDEDDIFSDVKTYKLNQTTKVQNTSVSEEKYNDISKGDRQTSKIEQPKNSSSVFESPSLFDDEDDECDLFAEVSKSSNIRNHATVHSKDFKEPSSITEVNISEDTLEKNVESIPPSSVKADDFEETGVKNENFNLNKESSPKFENYVNKIVESRSTEKDSITLTVSENLDRKDSNIETTAAKIIDHINIRNIEQSSSDTNNDFSDQDFDDLPQKEESNKNLNIVTETKNNEPTDIHNIFDSNKLEDNVYAKSKQSTDNSESIFKNTEPDFTETIPTDFKKTEKDNKTNQNPTKIKEEDIFSDILIEPPEFEKPKEPKKSKNVNALFDDDSDDESLFFKKNDPIFEENLEEFPPTQESLFGIFADEPPDDDFNKISDDLDDDMFSSLPKPKLPQNDNLPPIPDTLVFEDVILPKTDVKIPEIEKIDPVEDIFSTLLKNEVKPAVESPKIPVLETLKDSSEDISKLPTTLNVEHNEQEKSPAVFSDDEQLFNKIPEQESKLSFKDIISVDENLFQSIHKSEKPISILLHKEVPVTDTKNQETVSKTSDDELFTSLPITRKPSLDESKIVKQDGSSKSDEQLFKMPKSKPELVPRSVNNQKSAEISTTDSKSEKLETKKVGKLKVGLNINVNALLPGASPKKVKVNDQTDGQAQSVAENQKPESKIYSESQKPEPTIPESQNTDSKLLKSVCFDGKPESDVLDNKLSKERPKIQVKRRPSTRRARKEAVRKSGIDFGEDSTDNSSSIDDPPRIPTEKQPEIIDKGNTEDTNSKEIKKDVERQNILPERKDESQKQTKPEDTTVHDEIQTRLVEKDVTNQPAKVEKQAEVTEKPNNVRDVKSKVVYILNDEDIFNTSPAGKPDILKKDLTNLTKDSSLKTENTDLNTGVTTLGKVYDKSNTKNDSSTKKDAKKSLFEDDDDEMFKGKSAVKKTTIFDSDSEEELFGTSKKKETREVKTEIKREVVKGSLFGDEEDDDDDLFGVKTKKSVEQKPQPSRSAAKETPKARQPVFEDPLSMFSDDE